MLQCDRNDISEGTDVNKTNTSKECDICHYWYFSNKNFKRESYLCNGCHNLMQKAMSFNDVAIISIKERNCRIHIWYISKNDAIKIMKNSDLKKRIIRIFFSLCIKMHERTYYKRNRGTILNRAKYYYENKKKIL